MLRVAFWATFLFVSKSDSSLGSLDALKESRDFLAQFVGVASQFLSCAEHLAGGGSSFSSALLHVSNAAGHLLGSLCSFLNVAGDLRGRGALFLHCGSDGGRDLRHLADRLCNPLDRCHRLLGSLLHRSDLVRDLVRCLGGLGGEILHLARNDGEALPRFAGASRFDGGVLQKRLGDGDLIY